MIRGPSKPPLNWAQVALTIAFLLLVAFFAVLLFLGVRFDQNRPPPVDHHAPTSTSMPAPRP